MDRIGQRLKQVRANTSQKDFAEQLDVSVSKYQRIERGMSAPDIELLQKVLHAYPDVEPSWLLLGNNKNTLTGVDHGLLGEIIKTVDDILDKGSIHLASKPKADIIALLYELFILRKQLHNSEVDSETVNKYISVLITPDKFGADNH